MTFKVLITGSSGYIGSHLVKYFYQQGWSVFGIDIEFPPKQIQKYFTHHIIADISDRDHVEKLLVKDKPDVVVHCAAKCLVEESTREPTMYKDYNVDRASVFLEVCRRQKINHFIFSSSAATYGEPETSPIPESHRQKPVNPYGETKLQFEKILLAEQAKGGFSVGIVRYFNASGADLDSEIGEHHEPETHMIPNLISAMIQNKPISIFGNDYPTQDGTCVRDYIHVWDLAHFHYLLAKQMVDSRLGGIYNLGTSHGYSILETIEAAEKVLGKSAQKNFHPRRAGDPAMLVADSSKAQKELKWELHHSSLNTIIDSAYRWYLKKTDLL